jgi:hypothetical protein
VLPTVSDSLSPTTPSCSRASLPIDVDLVVIISLLDVNVLECLSITAIFEPLSASRASFRRPGRLSNRRADQDATLRVRDTDKPAFPRASSREGVRSP